MTTQTAFSVVAMFYALANLGSMGLELQLRETLTAFPGIDPNLMAMSLLMVTLPLLVWLALARFFVSRAGATRQEGAA